MENDNNGHPGHTFAGDFNLHNDLANNQNDKILEAKMRLKYYWEAMITQEPFVLAWEAFVLFMLLMFISIIVRLARIETKQDEIQQSLIDMDERRFTNG